MELKNWMANLEETCVQRPLTLLSIPGSHDSCSYCISDSSLLSPDGDAYQLLKVMGDLGRKLSAKWARAQDANLTEQLTAGLRYFDLRVLQTGSIESDSLRVSSAAICPGTFYFVHGQFAREVTSELFNVRTFLRENPKEVVILDFNHIYQCDDASALRLQTSVKQVFPGMLAPHTGSIPSLNELWSTGHQVICIFHCGPCIPEVWPAGCIQSPWPNTTDVDKLFQFLDANGPVDDNTFHVSQNILTPDAAFVFANLSKGLDSLAGPAGVRTMQWLRQRKAAPLGQSRRLNIVIVDFAVRALPDFARTVISLNTTQPMA
uniref:PI-PLC X domain-containing protein 3 n=2 Tax=Schistocephalus solidus TaxID=70667 RepID=A0A0X3Q3X1_SCHSO